MFIWSDWKGIVYFKPLSRNETLKTAAYYHQLDKLNEAIKEKYLELTNQNDNAWPYTSLVIGQKLLDFEYNVPSHHPYLSDFQLLESLKTPWVVEISTLVKIQHLGQFILNKHQKIFESRIMMLPIKIDIDNGTEIFILTKIIK